MPCKIGFVSTRFAGTDGVSLESAKWARILWDHQHISHWYAGKLDRDPADEFADEYAAPGFPPLHPFDSSDVIEVLGRTPLASRHHLQLIRLGRRLLLVSVTADHAETLTEITDVDEVNHVTSLCRRQQPGSITDSFRQVLHQLDHKTPQRS